MTTGKHTPLVEHGVADTGIVSTEAEVFMHRLQASLAMDGAPAWKITETLATSLQSLECQLRSDSLEPWEVYKPLLAAVTELTNYRTLLISAEAAILKLTWRLPFIFDMVSGVHCTLSPDEARDIYNSQKAQQRTHDHEYIQQFTSQQMAMQAILNHVHARYDSNDPTLVLDWTTLRTTLTDSLLALITARRSNDLEVIINKAGNVIYQAGCALIAPKATWLAALLARMNEASGDKDDSRAVCRAALSGPTTRSILAPKANHNWVQSFAGVQQVDEISAKDKQQTIYRAVVVLQTMFRQVSAKRQVLHQMDQQKMCKAVTIIQVMFWRRIAKREVLYWQRKRAIATILALLSGNAVRIETEQALTSFNKELAEDGNWTGPSEPARSLEFLQASILQTMLVRQLDAKLKAVGILQDVLGQLKAKQQGLRQIELWKIATRQALSKQQRDRMAVKIAGLRSKRTKHRNAQFGAAAFGHRGGGGRKSDNSRDGGRRSDNSRKNENGKLSRRSNQQNNSGATIISDTELECLYYSPGKGQRLIKKNRNRITEHVLDKVHVLDTVHLIGYKAANRLFRETLLLFAYILSISNKDPLKDRLRPRANWEQLRRWDFSEQSQSYYSHANQWHRKKTRSWRQREQCGEYIRSSMWSTFDRWSSTLLHHSASACAGG